MVEAVLKVADEEEVVVVVIVIDVVVDLDVVFVKAFLVAAAAELR